MNSWIQECSDSVLYCCFRVHCRTVIGEEVTGTRPGGASTPSDSNRLDVGPVSKTDQGSAAAGESQLNRPGNIRHPRAVWN